MRVLQVALVLRTKLLVCAVTMCVVLRAWFVVIVRGRQWLSRGIANPVSVAVRKLMKAEGIHRAGVGYYSLRHVFRTVADASLDFPAVRMIMGHSDNSIDAVYREHIDDERLLAVAQRVHDWLYGATETGKPSLKVVG